MRSLKMQILILILGSLLLLAVSFMGVLGWYMKDRALAAAIIKAKTDLATCSEIVDRTYPGPWRDQGGLLYKGSVEITNNIPLVDHLSGLTGDTVTFFLGDTRVATTVRGSTGKRAIGTKVSAVVARTVLQEGQNYLGQANVVGQIFQTAYEPLRADDGTIVGMFYVGISHSYDQVMIANSLKKMALLGGILTAAVGLLAWFFVQRVVIKPLHNITMGTRDVATGHAAEKIDVAGPSEIGELAGAFNQMVERLPLSSLPEKGPSVSDPDVSDPGMSGPGVSDPGVSDPGVSDSAGSDPFARICGSLDSKGLPKGLNEATLRQIIIFLSDKAVGPVSAEEVAEGVRLTRVTVRRYLEFLEQCGALKGELKYGSVGRPVKRFSRTCQEVFTDVGSQKAK
ncbi:transcriptional regulatory protein CitT [Peptococcaceae bacterium CEB3]|nr:transcriptional regulatory protein CitT [Peptococcaceae bacterium CEB3]